MTFPTVPTAVNVVTVCIVKAVKFTVRPASILKSLNVFDHATVIGNAPVVAFQKLLYVSPHQLKLFVVAVSTQVYFIVEVPALIVIPVFAEASHAGELVLFNSHVPDHIVRVLDKVHDVKNN